MYSFTVRVPNCGHQRLLAAKSLILAGFATTFLMGCVNRQIHQPPPAYTEILKGETDGRFEQVLEPVGLSFPEDHGSHKDFQVEWWYLSGFLQNEGGHEYGYQFTLFRYGLQRNERSHHSLFDRSTIYMGHFAVTDVSNQLFLSGERFARSPLMATVAGAGGTMNLHLDDWHMTIRDDNSLVLRVADHSAEVFFAADLSLKSFDPVLLHGTEGFSQKGPLPGQASMYYSLYNLETTGSLHVGEHSFEVHGTSWFDHEWSTGSLASDAIGWDWFSLQWDSAAALVLGGIRSGSSNSIAEFDSDQSHTYSYVSPIFVAPQGEVIRLEEDAYSISVTDYWTSDNTGVQYPSGWYLNLPELNIECEILPLMQGQEFIGVGIYWEGLVGTRCDFDGESKQGRGYVELTGYS